MFNEVIPRTHSRHRACTQTQTVPVTSVLPLPPMEPPRVHKERLEAAAVSVAVGTVGTSWARSSQLKLLVLVGRTGMWEGKLHGVRSCLTCLTSQALEREETLGCLVPGPSPPSAGS